MAQWLPTKYLDKINDAQRKLSSTLDIMDRLDHCGFDCQEIRKVHEVQFTQLEAFKRHFFPDSYLEEGPPLNPPQ